MQRWTLIYDGDCRFCRRQVERLRRSDRRGCIETVPFQTADLARFGIEREAVEQAMHLVAPTGRVWRGAEAARETFRLLPSGRPLVWLLNVPGAMFAAERVYRWVARRRHRFGCGSRVCRRGSVGG
jgi:predicted DCC family thiol-disulfide oxidoreductase YuxK